MGKNPAFQFYPADWTKDPELRRCSHAAKGVWIDMLCLMWECGERGVLATGGTAWSDEEIALAVGGRLDVTLTALDELTRLGVAKRNSAGAVYCARMVRDEQTRKQTKVRVQRHRSNGDVTPKKRKRNAPSSSSSSSSETPNGVSNPPAPSGGGFRAEEYPIPVSLDTPEFRTAWERWCAFRRKKRNPISEDACEGQIKKLLPHGPLVAIQAIEDAIAGDWKGLFPKAARQICERPASELEEMKRQRRDHLRAKHDP